MQILQEVCGNSKEMNMLMLLYGSSSFKYKSSLFRNPIAVAANANASIVAHALLRNVKIVVPLKYPSNFFRSLEMPTATFI